ncbi:MAG: ATP-dependent helicase [Hyphomicrobium zavarzinii]|jgi:superfamily I DNA/RNA helicase|uniref:UvrD-helicase domain-containing protein n=1 Tax=Hyphomicrobium zavarzinii TaxID=48292 RepID=UPI001A56088D|nr:ATP-dependent helicase [Hyphomicrobium zavarzinii]MBL8844539.1 ATP-dependent helicase [Hyphomicrobium zavarzinii]
MTLVLREKWKPQGVDDLEPRAWEALRQTERSVLVTAGAGAGKTEFLAQKATYLLQTGLCPAPKRILAISFKRDAARNLAERVAKRCPAEQARRFNSYTFDAFAKSLVDRFGAAVPEPYCPPADYRIVMPGRRDYTHFLGTHGFHGVNTDTFGRAIAGARLPVANEGSALQRSVAAYWHAQYNAQDEVLLSFPMINRLVELLIRENPSILKALHLTYPVVFLDEFQDTTFAQFQLLRTAFEGSGATFTAVGDNKQRIMVWAGAMPDAFAQFEQHFAAQRISLVCNWRSHEDLVRIQHIIASRIDPTVEEPEARAARLVDGDVAGIWEFESEDEESGCLAEWIEREVRTSTVAPHDVAILVRMHADEVERQLAPAFIERGLRLRNVARNVGDIAIQDLLGEDLTQILLRLMRVGAAMRSPENWNGALLDLQFLEAVDPADEMGQQSVRERLQKFAREMRRILRHLAPVPESAREAAQAALDFVGAEVLRRAFPSYQRQSDFDRVWNGFRLLLQECLQHAESWSGALDEFEGLGQIALMTIHKSKGLEFHTIIFYGLDNQSWWSLTPDREEELNSFFVAFTRAKQRAFFTLCTERGQPVVWIERLLAPAGVRRINSVDLLNE